MTISEVEVLSVARAAHGVTGEELVSVQFGVVAREQMSQIPIAMIGSPASVVLNLFFKFDEAAPYRVGSKWKLDVRGDGSLTLKEA